VTGNARFPVYLYFYQGGAGTFLNIFWRLHHAAMKELEEERANEGAVPSSGMGSVATNLIQGRQAFSDASDPSVVFLRQPNVRQRRSTAGVGAGENASGEGNAGGGDA